METTTTFSAPDIVCGGCADAIKKSLHRLDGVRDVTVNVPAKTVTVTHESDKAPTATITDTLDRAGFPVAA